MGFSTLEEEYTPEYWAQLEAGYGAGMMSEGGGEAIETMFDSVSLDGKSALDIGCGLGGVAFYLAETHSMQVIGLDVNAQMLAEAKKRIPDHLKSKVQFLLSTSNKNLQIPDESLDIVYSKSVLTHLETKNELFQECFRILKKGGMLVIIDWLSSEERKWGENIHKLMEMEHLTLYPESESGYVQVLKESGFTVHSIRDLSIDYQKYNLDIAKNLADPAKQQAHLKFFDQQSLDASVVGYTSIAKALEIGELRVMCFIAQKPN